MAPTAEQDSRVELVEKSRLERIVDVLSYASVGSFQEALQHAKVESEDGFGVLEEALRLVITELWDARQQMDVVLHDLKESKSELEQKLATIAAQKTAIQELSTPILDLWSDIVALPVVGTIDSVRAVEMTERLLQRVVEGGARCAIIDLTGVGVVDTTTADHLVKLLKATHLLGCFCVITGIGPDVARTLVELDLSFGGAMTRKTMQSGLKACFAHLDKASAASSRG